MDSDQSQGAAQRPLSPHLQAYRLPLTGWLSITHRLTGVLLSAGAVLMLMIPIAALSGPESYRQLQGVLASVVGRMLLWLWILSFIFHLCHGVRHLLWDAGAGFSREQLSRNAVFELLACVILTALVWVVSQRLI